MKLRKVTFQELEASPEKGSVWVVNQTKGSNRGPLVLTVPKLNSDGSDTLTIPATWVPVDITSVVSRAQLVQSNQFRVAVSKGLVDVVHNEDAAKLMESDAQAREENRRVTNQMLSNGDSTAGDSQYVELPEGVESFGYQAGKANLAPILSSTLQRVELESQGFSRKLTDEMDNQLARKVLEAGELPPDQLKSVWDKVNKVAPKLGAALRRSAGR